MLIERFIFNPFQENTCVVWDEAGGECIIVDAGNSTAGEDKALAGFIVAKGLRPVAAVNTHGHIDHLLGVDFVCREFGVPWLLGAGDKFLVETAAEQAEMFGLTFRGVPPIARELKEGDEVRFGSFVLRAISTPGHTPGHICLLGEGMLLTGDTLFKESIGRTDLPGGDYSWIMKSILDKLMPLGAEVAIFPGHGPQSTLGHEALYNPFITEILNGEVCV